LFPELLEAAGPAKDGCGTVLIGFDFPLGLPAAYADAASIANFRSALTRFGRGDWADFYTPAATRDEIALTRPFYPARNGPKGTVKREHLAAALGVASYQDLHRACDRDYPGRAAAAALFWTLGGNQVGKAAISGWRDLIAPALRRRDMPVRLWPFGGTLAALLAKPGLVVAETYPGEIYHHLGLAIAEPRRSKRRQADRAADAATLAGHTRRLGIDLSRDFAAALADGFGTDARGEDRFDAAVGLIGMVNILRGRRDPGDPKDRVRRRIEGWILGQADPPPS
ncbi:MAG: hypothetical protein VW644_02940, partial [Alphaproteobacteria bacterium]